MAVYTMDIRCFPVMFLFLYVRGHIQEWRSTLGHITYPARTSLIGYWTLRQQCIVDVVSLLSWRIFADGTQILKLATSCLILLHMKQLGTYWIQARWLLASGEHSCWGTYWLLSSKFETLLKIKFNKNGITGREFKRSSSLV
jgi:hypothetical protein